MKRWKRLSREDKFVNPYWTYRFETFELPDGKQGEYHYMNTTGSVWIVPITDDGRILLHRQYRYLFDKEVVEFPGGGVEVGGTFEQSAHKELIEETGYDGDLEEVGSFGPMIGLCDELAKVYIARNLRASDAYKPDDTEDFEYLKVTPQEIDDLIKSGEIWDGKSLSIWALVRHRFVE